MELRAKPRRRSAAGCGTDRRRAKSYSTYVEPAGGSTHPSALQIRRLQPKFHELSGLGVVHAIHRHPAVFTVAQAKALRGQLEGVHVKNLFLRDKKRRFWLVRAPEDRVVDLKVLRRSLGARGGLGFASPEQLLEHLGVVPGAVTPLAAINDPDGAVTVVLDRAILAADRVNVHPNHNAATVGLSPDDVVRFLVHVGHPPQLVDLA